MKIQSLIQNKVKMYNQKEEKIKKILLMTKIMSRKFCWKEDKDNDENNDHR